VSAAPAGMPPARQAWERARRAPTWRARGREGSASKRLAGGIGVSAALHAAALVALLLHRPTPRAAEPPVYRVDLVAAPPGPRSIGTVTPTPPAPAPTPTPPTPAPAPPPRAEAPPKTKALPTPTKAKPKPAPPKATPMPPSKTTPPKSTAAKPKTTTPSPRAGGGPEGGQGADVANVHVKGLDFPFPGYLQNIVRQVALRFSPPNRAATLQADVSFLIHRDGSVSDVRVVKGSGSYGFDLEARGAIEAVSSARAFGPLPDTFHDDVLPVTFSFDPRVIR